MTKEGMQDTPDADYSGLDEFTRDSDGLTRKACEDAEMSDLMDARADAAAWGQTLVACTTVINLKAAAYSLSVSLRRLFEATEATATRQYAPLQESLSKLSRSFEHVTGELLVLNDGPTATNDDLKSIATTRRNASKKLSKFLIQFDELVESLAKHP